MGRGVGVAGFIVLQAVARGIRYGLDIMERTDLPSGTVYPALAALERRGYLAGTWENERVAAGDGRPRRRYYKLTAFGAEALKEAVRRFELPEPEGIPKLPQPLRAR